MQLIAETFVKNVRLVDNGRYAEGRARFWDDLADFMSTRFFANIQFDKKPPSGIEAYFSRSRFDYDTIYIPEDKARVTLEGSGVGTTGTVEFVDDYAFALFLHEASHYIHLIKDGGKFTAPSLESRKAVAMTKSGAHAAVDTIDLEYEAGYRSLRTSKAYGLFPEGDRTVLELNLSNMLNYIDILNRKDFEGCDPEVFKRRIEEWKHSTGYDEISDYMTVV